MLCNTVFLINRVPSNALEGKTPYQVLYGTLLDLNIKISTIANHRGKLDSRAKKCALLGYKAGMKGFVTYDMSSKQILVSSNAVFYEHIFPCVSQIKNTAGAPWQYIDPSSQAPTSTLTLDINPITITTPNLENQVQRDYQNGTLLLSIHDQISINLGSEPETA
ncbi:hypothetical protein CR513_30464, partial [Mucuna pruriens]